MHPACHFELKRHSSFAYLYRKDILLQDVIKFNDITENSYPLSELLTVIHGISNAETDIYTAVRYFAMKIRCN